MDKFKKGGNKFNSNLAATNRLFAKNPLLKKRRKKAPGIYDPNAKYKFPDGGPTNPPQPICEDERCEETDKAQELLDKADELRYKNVGLMWDVADKVNPDGRPPGNAAAVWKQYGAGSLGNRLGMDNPANCMWAAGSGYQCLPETKGKIPLTSFESNDKFINAVSAGKTPFRRVDVTTNPNFDRPETGLLRTGDIVNIKGNGHSHAMTFSHYREDGVPIYLDSNGDARDFSWNQGMIPGMVPGKNGTKAYVHRLDPEALYQKEIDQLEEKARTNPTYYEDGGEYFEMDLTPEEIEEYAKGGFIVEDISVPELNQMEEGGAACPQGYIRVHGKCVPIHNMVNNRVDPYYTSNPYDPRIKAFKDSLDLYNGNAGDYKILRENNMIPHIANNSELNKGQKKYIKSAKIKPKYYVKGDRTSKTPAGYMSHMFPVFAPPRQEVIYKPKPKPKKQVVKKVEEKPIIKEQVVVEEPMQMMPIQHVTKVDTPLQKFIGTAPVTPKAEVMPTDETVEDVGYTEGGPDGPNVDWVDHTQRYIDWDGNSIGFNGIRFRKPGHGGDLIKKGRRHYLHYPSIESRYQAELVPEETEEEYAFGGEYNEGDEVELTEAEVKRLRSLGYIIEEA